MISRFIMLASFAVVIAITLDLLPTPIAGQGPDLNGEVFSW